MKRLTRVLLFFSLALAVACSEVPDIVHISEEDGIAGTWRYAERGYSPGSGYITEPVPPLPLQTITFRRDFTMKATIEGLEKFRFYRVLDHNGEKILAMFEIPPVITPDVNELKHSYIVSYEEEDAVLKLQYRFCIEGCHIGLVSMDD